MAAVPFPVPEGRKPGASVKRAVVNGASAVEKIAISRCLTRSMLIDRQIERIIAERETQITGFQMEEKNRGRNSVFSGRC
jgi:hypothetical protein